MAMNIATVLHNDAVLPAQFSTPAATRSGYHRLLLAILEDALASLKNAAHAIRLGVRPFHHRKLLAEIRAWFASEEVIYGSFLYICEHLDIDPRAFRRQLTSGSLQAMPRRRILAHPGGYKGLVTSAYYQRGRRSA